MALARSFSMSMAVSRCKTSTRRTRVVGSVFLTAVLSVEPEMDGLETATSIRQRETKTQKRTPIIALTAHAESDFRDECLAAGMDHFLTKPLQPRKLFDALKRVAISQQQQS